MVNEKKNKETKGFGAKIKYFNFQERRKGKGVTQAIVRAERSSASLSG